MDKSYPSSLVDGVARLKFLVWLVVPVRNLLVAGWTWYDFIRLSGGVRSEFCRWLIGPAPARMLSPVRVAATGSRESFVGFHEKINPNSKLRVIYIVTTGSDACAYSSEPVSNRTRHGFQYDSMPSIITERLPANDFSYSQTPASEIPRLCCYGRFPKVYGISPASR